jgi:hypothetical protein
LGIAKARLANDRYPTIADYRNDTKYRQSRRNTRQQIRVSLVFDCVVYLSGAADKQLAIVQQQRADRRSDAAQRLEARAVRALGQVQSAIVAARVLVIGVGGWM